MKLKVYAVHDSKVGAYLQPFFMRSRGEALRTWMTSVNDPKSQFNKYPGDFTLFEIGEYNEESGILTALPTHENLGKALDVLSRDEKDAVTPLIKREA